MGWMVTRFIDDGDGECVGGGVTDQNDVYDNDSTHASGGECWITSRSESMLILIMLHHG